MIDKHTEIRAAWSDIPPGKTPRGLFYKTKQRVSTNSSNCTVSWWEKISAYLLSKTCGGKTRALRRWFEPAVLLIVFECFSAIASSDGGWVFPKTGLLALRHTQITSSGRLALQPLQPKTLMPPGWRCTGIWERHQSGSWCTAWIRKQSYQLPAAISSYRTDASICFAKLLSVWETPHVHEFHPQLSKK